MMVIDGSEVEYNCGEQTCFQTGKLLMDTDNPVEDNCSGHICV